MEKSKNNDYYDDEYINADDNKSYDAPTWTSILYKKWVR